jgi:hypothetical protein
MDTSTPGVSLATDSVGSLSLAIDIQSAQIHGD